MFQDTVEGRADSSPVKPTRNYEHGATRKGDVGRNDNRSNLKMADQGLSNDLKARLLKLYRQVSAEQKQLMRLAAVLSAAANDEEAVQA